MLTKQLFIQEEDKMVSWGWLIVTFMVGGFFGIFTTALCNVTKDNDKENQK